MNYQEEFLTVNLAITRISGVSSNWSTLKGYNASEFSLMFVLMSKETVTQKDICDMTAMPKQTVNNIIREWKKDGYVELVSDPTDKRVKSLKLTEAGKQYVNAAFQPVHEIQEDVVKAMGEDKFLEFSNMLDDYYQLLSNVMAKNAGGKIKYGE